MTKPIISVEEFRKWLDDGKELAVLDLRDEASFAKGAPLYATNVPADKVDAVFDIFVPRAAVRTVLVDDGSGIATEKAEQLIAGGKPNVVALEGGIPAWSASGSDDLPTFDTPGVVFSLAVRDEKETPVVTAAELKAWRDAGEDVVVLDTRTLPEFARDHVPGAIGVPGAELLLRFTDLVPSPETKVLVSCAGLPRAILGAQTLIDAGIPNDVAYLDRGTAGWRDEGLSLEEGATEVFGPASERAVEAAAVYTKRLAEQGNIPRIDEATARAWQADPDRTTYLLDVRTPEEFAAGHLDNTLSSEGGQLLGVAHRTIAVRGARVVLIDDLSESRAVTTAHWLSRRGYEIAILPYDFSATELRAAS